MRVVRWMSMCVNGSLNFVSNDALWLLRMNDHDWMFWFDNCRVWTLELAGSVNIECEWEERNENEILSATLPTAQIYDHCLVYSFLLLAVIYRNFLQSVHLIFLSFNLNLLKWLNPDLQASSRKFLISSHFSRFSVPSLYRVFHLSCIHKLALV